ncbi:outer membrane OprD family porin [Cecembia rubra]|uniref:Outer membrane OprD family porin n=2 Tax=Cecembia rubra TaxID=1485585 RepID=A0A2P8E2Y4_9BACT|nr:outer membrane OprD family porin [Cecembia rubra]
MLRLLIFVIFFATGSQSFAQMDLVEKDSTQVQEEQESLGRTLKSGEIDFHIRSFFMSTLNKGKLSDYATLATGAGIGYTTPEWRGFQARFNGFFTFQVFEYNVRVPDPITGAGNRYELLLYDMNDLSNTNRLDRLEELYLSYRKNRFKFTFGRQKINSPLLNEQDNRMRPNVFGGFSAVYSGMSTKLTAMWINSVTIRGTVDWYTIEDSYGVYPFGRNLYGEPSDYRGKIKSKGIAMTGLQYHKSGLTLQGWNYFAENVFNMTFLQSDYVINIGKTRIHTGIQGFHQIPINDGGNPDTQKTYIHPDENASGLGAKIGLFSGRHNVSFNFLGINDKGRFLFPREWGREILYASMSRERFEGAGDMHALVLKYDLITPVKGLFAQFGAGKVNLSEVNDYRTNKYGLPSYYHFSGMLDYRFKDYFEGINLSLLVVNKAPQNREMMTDRLRINRVEMWNINLVMDYRF